MDMIKKSDIMDSYYTDGYSGNEIINMIIYEEIPTIKAIPLDRIKEYKSDENKALSEIEQILKDHDEDSMPEDFFYIDKIREVINKWKINKWEKNI